MEKSFLKALTGVLRPSNEILQIGFGSGLVAEYLQTFHPKRHLIIESHQETLTRAKKWALKYPQVSILPDRWENTLTNSDVFDAIIFSDFSLANQAKGFCSETGKLALQKGNALSAMVEEKVPHLTSIRYSDEDIDAFYKHVGKDHEKDLSRFLGELAQRGQISESQYENAIRRYHLKKEKSTPLNKPTDLLFTFLLQCLKNHMRKGSRFYGFSGDPTSKYEDPQFFEQIIVNPHVDYQEITLSEGGDEALMIVIEKRT